MKFKYHLIRFLLIFVALFIPSVISTAVNMSGNSLGGLGILIVFTPFFYFIHCVYIGKVGPKLPQKTKEVDSIPITPEMLAASASDDVPEAEEEPMTHEERSKDIDACLQKAISDCAQGKISAKEFADICALLRQVENKPSISAQGVGKRNQQPTTEETYLVEDDNGFLVRVPTDKLDSWAAADHDAPLTPAEEQFKEKLLESIYHKTTTEDKSSAAGPKENRAYIQSKVVLPHEKDRTAEKPIGCIPNSNYVPIPWWRNTRIMARMALGLIGVTLICAVIFAIVPGLPDPTAAVSSAPTPSASSPPTPIESLSLQERLDLMQQHANNNNQPLPRPSNGWVAYSTYRYGERIAPLTINASSLTSDFYIKLRRPDTKAEVVSFYIHGNTQKTVYVPLGSFEILYASGSDWYGTDLFGPETSYCLFDELFDFYKEDDYINGWTITLEKQYNGNLDSNQISADEFFGG